MEGNYLSRRRVLQMSGTAAAASVGVVGTAAADPSHCASSCDAYVTFNDQTVGPDCDTGETADTPTDSDSVTVAEANLPCGGYVDIHDPDEKHGGKYKGGIGIGATQYLEGAHTDICIDLWEQNDTFGTCVGDDWERTHLQNEQKLVAMLHLDTDGDGHFTHWCSHETGTQSATKGTDHAYLCDQDGDGDVEPIKDSAIVTPD